MASLRFVASLLSATSFTSTLSSRAAAHGGRLASSTEAFEVACHLATWLEETATEAHVTVTPQRLLSRRAISRSDFSRLITYYYAFSIGLASRQRTMTPFFALQD